MFFIKKLLTPFLVPPGIFVAFALCMAAVRSGKDKARARFWAALALLLWGAALPPLGTMALSGLEYAYLPPSRAEADAIVVLSGGVREGAPEPFGGPALSDVSAERATEAFRIYRKLGLPLVVTGGAVFSGSSEAAAMKSYLVSLGVPERMVFTEEKARDTAENARFSKRLCDEKGFKRVILVTSAYHMRRAVWSFERAGFTALVPWPSGYRTAPEWRWHWTDCLPGSFDPLRMAVQERIGLLFYRSSM
ncbi:MAG TPA: YdcF family protein [Elusimicrobiales bacterium]|nr:YdcF family protein [Elusimicrobiales bacterium]